MSAVFSASYPPGVPGLFFSGELILQKKYIALEGLINTYITAGNPVGLSESMMDHDYTLLALTRYAEGSKSFWGAVMAGAQKTEASVVEPLLAFQKRDLKSFKVLATPNPTHH